MSDEVSWGVYIANFTFLVGVAAAAVMMVIPVYIYNNEELHDLVIFGELLAVAAIIMCLSFVTVDLGRPGPVLASHPRHRAVQFPALHAELGRDCAQRLSAAERPYLRLSVVLPLSEKNAGQMVLRSVCVHRHRLGHFDSYRHGVSLRGTGRPAVLELSHRRPALSRLGLHRRAGADHPGDASGAPRHRRCLPAECTRRRAQAGMAKAASSRAATWTIWICWPATCPNWPRFRRRPARTFLAGAVVLEVAAGDVLLRQGETDDEAFFVLKGRVVVKREENGRFRDHPQLGPGEQFGEVSALAEPRASPRPSPRKPPRCCASRRIVCASS